MASEQSAAWPVADQALAQQLLDLLQQATHYRQAKKGANEGGHNHSDQATWMIDADA